MNEELIKGQKDNSLTINYNKWIFDNISPYIGDKVMDVGAGRGNFLNYLLDRKTVVAIDILDVFIDNLYHLKGSKNNVHIFKYDIQDERIIQIVQNFCLDTVICNNVLEHVRDDRKALNNIYKILHNNGSLILVLPAFQCLYSNWDTAVGHFRRYDYKDIKAKLLEVGFKICVNFYMNIVGFLGWFFNGRILMNTPMKSSCVEKQAIFFDRYIVKSLRKLEELFPPMFGLSLIIVAQPV